MPSIGIVPGLPDGGFPGQALTKTSANDYDYGWTTPAGSAPAPMYVSGMWYDHRTCAVSANQTAVIAPGAARIWSWFTPQPVTIKAVAITINTAPTGATAPGVLGISAHNPATGKPGAVLTSVSKTLATTGTVTATLAYTIPAGWVWFWIANPSGNTGNCSLAGLLPYVGNWHPCMHFGNGTLPSTTAPFAPSYTTPAPVVDNPTAMTLVTNPQPIMYFQV